MNLTKEEKNLLAIENFLHKLKEDFPSVTQANLTILDMADFTNLYRPKKGGFPFSIKIEHNNLNSYYSWELGTSDDEYPVYDKYDNHYGYQEFKKYVMENLPEAFKGKIFYQTERHLNFENISEYTSPIKTKLMAISLDKELDSKPISKTSKPRKI